MKTLKAFVIANCLALLVVLLTSSFINYQRNNAKGKNDQLVEANQAIQSSHAIKKTPQKLNDNGFAVVELFTSEGCSSCPPADDLVASIQKQNEGKQIYILAFHVDYWDRQGWKDVFSDAGYTKRQRQYAYLLNLQTVYTPQIVVNGRTEFVGSDQGKLISAITDGLKHQPSGTLTLNAVEQQGHLTVNYEAGEAGKHTDIVLALVQKSAQSKVRAGENAGATLSHVQIVRKMVTQPVSETGKGQVNITLPDGFNAAGWELIGIAQNKSNGSILAAARTGFSAVKS